jgi:hypothetical protein
MNAMTIEQRVERLLRRLAEGRPVRASQRQEAGRLLAEMEHAGFCQDYTVARPGWDPATGFTAQDKPSNRRARRNADYATVIAPSRTS